MINRNLIIIEQIYEAFEKRDFVAFFKLLSPQVSIFQCPEMPFGGSYTGLDGARTFFETVGSYLDTHITIESTIDAGERIAILGRVTGTVVSNGQTFDSPVLHLWGFKDGLANRLEIALDVPTLQAAMNN